MTDVFADHNIRLEKNIELLRQVRDTLTQVYWDTHKGAEGLSFESRSEQFRGVARLGKLADSIVHLDKAVSSVMDAWMRRRGEKS